MHASNQKLTLMGLVLTFKTLHDNEIDCIFKMTEYVVRTYMPPIGSLSVAFCFCGGIGTPPKNGSRTELGILQIVVH